MFLLLMVIAFYDIRQRRIPLVLTISGVVFWIGRIGVNQMWKSNAQMVSLAYDLALAMGIMGICLLLNLARKGSIGGGDILLMGMMTLLSGRITMTGSMVITFVLIFAVSTALLILGCKKTMTLPFAPFLLAGYTIWSIIRYFGT